MSDLTTQGATDVATALLSALYTSGATRLGVGDSATAFSVGQTALQGTNTKYNAVTSATRTGAILTYETTYGASEANFTWREMCVDRTTSMLVRKVLTNAITKPSGEEWTLQVNVEFTPG